MWTQFWDMHSGGGLKESPYSQIYIEAPADEAKRIFYAKFGHNPERVTCTCCGEDYAVDESPTLEAASAYQRNCRYDQAQKRYVEEQGAYGTYQAVSEYVKNGNVLIIRADDIKDEWRTAEVPQQGYVWVG